MPGHPQLVQGRRAKVRGVRVHTRWSPTSLSANGPQARRLRGKRQWPLRAHGCPHADDGVSLRGVRASLSCGATHRLAIRFVNPDRLTRTGGGALRRHGGTLPWRRPRHRHNDLRAPYAGLRTSVMTRFSWRLRFYLGARADRRLGLDDTGELGDGIGQLSDARGKFWIGNSIAIFPPLRPRHATRLDRRSFRRSARAVCQPWVHQDGGYTVGRSMG